MYRSTKCVDNLITSADLATETFELQSNELYGVSLATKCQLRSDHQLQEFKENREVSTKLTEQPQSNEQLELKRNEASTTSQILTVA